MCMITLFIHANRTYATLWDTANQLVQNFSSCCGTRKFIVMVTRPTFGSYSYPDKSDQNFVLRFLKIQIHINTFNQAKEKNKWPVHVNAAFKIRNS
jgi:predicted RNA methylase